MIRQNAFIEEGSFLKGELHCHTTRSDGVLTPSEAMSVFRENNYDFVALTDHRVYNFDHPDPQNGVILIPGMEFDNTFYTAKNSWHCFHTVAIGPERESGNGYLNGEKFESGTAGSQEEYQEYLDRMHANKNLTVLCHPEWSQTPAKYIDRLKGNFAIEVWNTGSVISYNCDDDAAYWDELLGSGMRIFGVAADDAHGRGAYCKGWVMVKARKNVNSILSSLASGAFYSTTGPEIYDFFVDDEGYANIKCSPVSAITMSCFGHLQRTLRSENDGLTEAKFPIKNWTGECPYVRITVYSGDGKRAWTNPIWLK